MDSILHNQSNAEYHQNPALGSTTIKEWSLKSPAHAMYGERTINSYIAAEGTAALRNLLESGKVLTGYKGRAKTYFSRKKIRVV